MIFLVSSFRYSIREIKRAMAAGFPARASVINAFGSEGMLIPFFIPLIEEFFEADPWILPALAPLPYLS